MPTQNKELPSKYEQIWEKTIKSKTSLNNSQQLVSQLCIQLEACPIKQPQSTYIRVLREAAPLPLSLCHRNMF